MQGLVKTYPNTKAYCIIFHPGSSGNFIKTLIYSFYYPNQINFDYKDGNAHYEVSIDVENKIERLGHHNLEKLIAQDRSKNAINRHKYLNLAFKKLYQPYDLSEPINSDKPVLFTTHALINFDNYKAMYPKGKIIIITNTSEENKILRGNFFYKFLSRTYHISLESKTDWDKCREKYNFGNIEPSEATVEQVGKYIDSAPKKVVNFFELLSQHKDTYEIKFIDIVKNKNTVLETISKITELPILENTHKLYDKYVEAQIKLFKEKMPWAIKLYE